MIAFDAGKLPDNFSSDHRLAGFGALSGGVILSKILGKGVALETGFEYYTRASSMQIGGGNNSFADFDYYVANAAIKFDIEPTTNSLPMGSSGGSAASHHAHASAHHHHKIPPAGIMFGHMLDKPGDFMAGYRFMYNWTGGSMLHGTHKASDQTIIDQGCSADCQFTPKYMDMRMHMIDLMYAPTKWLNVMLMPTFMDMDMNLRELSGNKDPITSGAHTHHGAAGHETGAISDTYFASSGPTRSPTIATLPFTLTSPAAINASISRRDPNPFCARSFCNLKVVEVDTCEDSGACPLGALLETDAFFFTGLIGLFTFINF